MAQTMRFGRRVALPSTRQIIHELRVFAAKEDARLAAVPVAAGVATDDEKPDLSLPSKL